MLFTLGFLFSCDRPADELLGTWKVNSKFYKATYEVIEEADEIKALVKYYDDDTFRYSFDSTNVHYVFTSLKKKGDQYVDGVSGATVKNADAKGLSISIKAKDTLEVTSYVLDKPLVETWTRIH